jgi:hypothetical protein
MLLLAHKAANVFALEFSGPNTSAHGHLRAGDLCRQQRPVRALPAWPLLQHDWGLPQVPCGDLPAGQRGRVVLRVPRRPGFGRVGLVLLRVRPRPVPKEQHRVRVVPRRVICAVSKER